jgi:hypothetical protein
MLQHFLSVHAFLRFFDKHVRDEKLCRHFNMIPAPVKMQLALLDLFFKLKSTIVVKWQLPAQKRKSNHSNGPAVALNAVFLLG